MEKRIEQLEKDMKYLINRVKELNNEIQTLKENETIVHTSQNAYFVTKNLHDK